MGKPKAKAPAINVDKVNKAVNDMLNSKTTEHQKKAAKRSNDDTTKGIVEVGSHITAPVNGKDLTYDKALPAAKTQIANGMQMLTACVAMQNLTKEQVRDTFDYVKGVEDALEDTAKLARARVLSNALKYGKPTGTTGDSRRIEYEDGTYQLAKATKTGIDPKKWEAQLRAKNAPVQKYMAQVITYKMPTDFDAVKQAIDDEVMTQEEADACKYDPSYAVERSKEGKAE